MPNDVLIVEDDALIALDFESTIVNFGVARVRTATQVAQALEMIAERPPDFALLDVGMGTETSLDVAATLETRGIPFAFVTGYRADMALTGRFADRPTLSKPCLREEIEALLRDLRATTMRSADAASET